MRVYSIVEGPTAREIVGYLLVRGGVHALAYARALELFTGMKVTKMLPIPDMSNGAYPETKKFMQNGMRRKLYTFSQKDYRQASIIWNGMHPDDGQPLEFIRGAMEGVPTPDLEAEPQFNTPGSEDFDPQMFADTAKRTGIKYQY